MTMPSAHVRVGTSSKNFVRIFLGLVIIGCLIYSILTAVGWPTIASLLAGIYYEITGFRDMSETNFDQQQSSILSTWNKMTDRQT